MKYFRPIIRILLSISVLVILILAFVFIPKQRCEGLSAIPHTKNETLILAQDDIETILQQAGISYKDKKIKEVEEILGDVTKLLNANPFVEKVNFVHCSGRKLVVDYTLKNIVMHVFASNGNHYFVDENGKIVPFTSNMQDYLMIVNGDVPETVKVGSKVKNQLLEALKVTKKIYSDEFSRAQYRQMYVSGNNLELVSTIGGQIVIIGSSENIDEKLSNLKTVYENGLSHKGYNTYALLDARYKNRIIATKHN